jgi:hypothetical protein
MKKFFKFILVFSFLILFCKSRVLAQLEAPSNPSPEDGGVLFTYKHYISWDPVSGANFYQYKIDYTSKSSQEDNPSCTAGTEAVPPTIISSESAYVSFDCLGTYSWRVQACADENCQDSGPWSVWSFDYTKLTASTGGGIIPCGRKSDNPKTDWVDETEDCEFRHLFLIPKNIIDFILWRLGLIVLVILIIATFVIGYFSMGSPVMGRIKSIWKAAAQGYAIMLLAWTIINLILRILGFPIKWWIIPF